MPRRTHDDRSPGVRRWLANPVVVFLMAGLVLLVAVVVGTDRLSQRAADDEAIVDARSTTALLAGSVAQPAITQGLIDGKPADIRRFARTVLSRLRVGDVQRIKIWRRDGRIVFSDKAALIGSRYPLGEDETEILEKGGTDAEISDLSRPENRFERGHGDLLEVYTRLRSPTGQPLLFEAYYSASAIAQRRTEVYHSFQPIALGGLLLLVIGTTPLLWALTRRLDRIRRDRERLLEAAAEASERERRRIARDLHDGVVQDLAGTSFALAAVARDATTTATTATRLAPMSESLRGSLRSLRSLLVEIYPPDLRADGLAAALQDLVAPAIGMGIDATVEVTGMHQASEDAVRLIWRVAQEAVRNAFRHAQPSQVRVVVSRTADVAILEVSDDGVGFPVEPSPASDSGGFGLRGLRDLIREERGTLEIRRAPGGGTTIHLEVRR